MTTGEDSGADETAKRRFSQGNADAVKGPSAGEAEKWKLELVRIWVLFSYSSTFYVFFYCGIHTIKFSAFAILTSII